MDRPAQIMPFRIALFLSVLFLIPSTLPAAPSFNSVRASSEEVGLYEKIELRVSLDASFSNPFDPAEIDLVAEFTAPSGKKWIIPGFYNPSAWDALWMARFAPDEPGDWRYVLSVRDREGSARSEQGGFTATGSGAPGYVRIADNGRYLVHGDGSSFYPVGLWYNDSYERFGGGQISADGLDRLKRRGGNFICFFPTPLETMGTGVGRYDQNRSGRLDQLFEWCEERGIKISWNLWFHSYLSETIWGGGNARWLTNPYRNVCEAVDFFASEEAWGYQEKLYRYILARWGYSPSLFLWFVIDEIDGTEGWARGDTLAAEAWSRRVHDWFRANDPWGRPTTGTKCGAYPQYWPGGCRIFDIAAREIYEAQRWPMPKGARVDGKEELPLRASYLQYAGESAKLWREYGKPGIIGECGWSHTYYEPSQPGYMAMYHNALWASLVNGLCATPFWWAWSEMLNDNVVNSQLEAFSRFVGELDLTGADPGPLPVRADKGLDAWAMKNGGTVFGWAVNPRLGEGIAGRRVTVEGLEDGEYTLIIYHAWRGRRLSEDTVRVTGGRLTVTAPELFTTGGRANQLGDDFAFVLERKK